MTLYTFALALGGTGLVAMAAMGAAHLGGDGHHAGGHDVGQGADHGVGPNHSAGHGHAGHPLANGSHQGSHESGHDHGHTNGHDTHDGALKGTLMSLMSPRVLFSLLIGFGGTGILLGQWASGVVLFTTALLGGIALEVAFVRPLWNFMFRFASQPAQTLEGSIASLATATSGFDASGHGLVAIEVDGQVVQCLGTLRADDVALGIRVRSGDRLRVEEVDAARNQCVVAYVGHS